jgi:hypothetical protein
VKLIYQTNDGRHEETLQEGFHTFRFSNGIPADLERLRFYAEHCNGYIEATEAELPDCRLPDFLEIKHGRTTRK